LTRREGNFDRLKFSFLAPRYFRAADSSISKILRFVDKPEFCDARGSRSMKPRFRNANLLITHVVDSCVKLLAVLHISSAQGRSVDLSVEIAMGRRRMLDMILNIGDQEVAWCII